MNLNCRTQAVCISIVLGRLFPFAQLTKAEIIAVIVFKSHLSDIDFVG